MGRLGSKSRTNGSYNPKSVQNLASLTDCQLNLIAIGSYGWEIAPSICVMSLLISGSYVENIVQKYHLSEKEIANNSPINV